MISALSYLRARPVRSGPAVVPPRPLTEWHLTQFRPLASKKSSSPFRSSPEWASEGEARSDSIPVGRGFVAKIGSEGSESWTLNDQTPIPCRERSRRRFIPFVRRMRTRSESGA